MCLQSDSHFKLCAFKSKFWVWKVFQYVFDTHVTLKLMFQVTHTFQDVTKFEIHDFQNVGFPQLGLWEISADVPRVTDLTASSSQPSSNPVETILRKKLRVGSMCFQCSQWKLFSVVTPECHLISGFEIECWQSAEATGRQEVTEKTLHVSHAWCKPCQKYPIKAGVY